MPAETLANKGKIFCIEKNENLPTVGAQSVAQACQNFVNWPRNISAHRRLRKLTLLFAKKSYKSKTTKFSYF
jgi:hypothetical protein